MNHLNDDCLNRVFAHLDLRTSFKVEVVCRHWRQLLRQPAAHSRIRQLDLSEYLIGHHHSAKSGDSESGAEPIMEELLRRCGPSLRHLSFGARWLHLTQRTLHLLATHCHQLTHLDLGCVIIHASVSPLLERVAPQLEVFSLEESSWASGWDGGERLAQHFPAMRKLRKLNLRSYAFPLDGLMSIPSEELEAVDVSNARHLPAQTLVEFLHNHPNLKELSLCPFPYTKSGFQLKGRRGLSLDSNSTLVKGRAPTASRDGNGKLDSVQAVLNAIGEEQKCLRTLTLGFLRGSVDEGPRLSALGALPDSLRHMHLQDCPSLDTRQLDSILNNKRELRSLSLLNCPNVGEHGSLIASYCPLLSQFEISANSHLTNADLLAIVEGCPTLRRLRLERCPLVGNEGVLGIVGKLHRRVRELEIIGCENIGADLFAQKRNTELGGQGQDTSWSRVGDLRSLAVNGCPNLSNDSVRELENLGCLATLAQLDVSHNMAIDDLAIRTLTEHLRKLRDTGRRPMRAAPLLVYVFQTGVSREHTILSDDPKMNGDERLVELLF